MNWFAAKTLEAHKYLDDPNRYPFVVLENLVLVKEENLELAKSKVNSIAAEQADLLRIPIYFNGSAGLVCFEGIREIHIVDLENSKFETGTVLSSASYRPLCEMEGSNLIEQSRVLHLKYLAEGSVKAGRRLSNFKFQIKNQDASEPWQSAHLIYSLTSEDGRLELVYEETVLIDSALDVWSIAESIGNADFKNHRQAKYRDQIFDLHFEGVRQVIEISGYDATGIPQDTTEATYSKFEASDPSELSRLLNDEDATINLIPSSVSHFQLGATFD